MSHTLIFEEARARQLGRTIASDLALYNGTQIDQTIADDNFFEAFATELAQGRALYQRRLDPALDPDDTFLMQAVVDIILYVRGHISSPMW